MNIWSILFMGGAVFGLLYTALSLLLLIHSSQRKLVQSFPAFAPPISVFKPLKGIDESLLSNLESFFRLDYPCYELIFGINDADDPVIPAIRKLQAANPHVASKLIVDTRRTGYNPKVNNLCNMAPHASFRYWVISDSNVRVNNRYLLQLVAQMRDPGVGLVTSLIRGVGGKRLGARLENLHLNSFTAASAVAINRLSSIPVSIGKSMLLRRETIVQLGGFEAFANYLLEDGLIGRQVRKLGLRTETSMHAIENVNEFWSVRDFLRRQYRWGLMRRQLNLLHYSGEILTNPICLALVSALVSPSVFAVALLAGVCAAKVVFDLLTIREVGGAVTPSSAFLLPVKDLLIGLIWWKPFFTNRVSWRGNHFRIGAMTRISPVGTVGTFRTIRGRGIVTSLGRSVRNTQQRLMTWGARA